MRFDVECRKSSLINSTSKPVNKKKTSLRQKCRVLKKPLLRQKLIGSLIKQTRVDHNKILTGIKHRYLRLRHLQHKQRILKSIDKMESSIDQILKENNEQLADDEQLTKLERKKTAIRKLLTSPTTKFPISLDQTQPIEEKKLDKPSLSVPLQLVDLLIQTTAKTRVNLCNKLHPTFRSIESSEKWKNKSDVLEVNYKDTNKVCSHIIFTYKSIIWCVFRNWLCLTTRWRISLTSSILAHPKLQANQSNQTKR